MQARATTKTSKTTANARKLGKRDAATRGRARSPSVAGAGAGRVTLEAGYAWGANCVGDPQERGRANGPEVRRGQPERRSESVAEPARPSRTLGSVGACVWVHGCMGAWVWADIWALRRHPAPTGWMCCPLCIRCSACCKDLPLRQRRGGDAAAAARSAASPPRAAAAKAAFVWKASRGPPQESTLVGPRGSSIGGHLTEVQRRCPMPTPRGAPLRLLRFRLVPARFRTAPEQPKRRPCGPRAPPESAARSGAREAPLRHPSRARAPPEWRRSAAKAPTERRSSGPAHTKRPRGKGWAPA